MQVWLVRYGEIFLKGKNRSMFEKKLVSNIKDCLKKNKISFNKILHISNRVLVYSNVDCSCIKYVFGITSISKAYEINQEINAMNETALKLYKKGSFRISAQRLEKKFKHTSNQINKIVGAFIVKNKKAKVSLENPGTNIGIELFNNNAYIFNEKINCLGGLPVGVEGKVALILEDKNSLIAGILMLKRGCSIVLVEKKKIDCSLLKKFCYGFDLKSATAIPKDAKAIVVNDTLDGIKKRNFAKTVFRPLIGYKKEELEKWLAYS